MRFFVDALGIFASILIFMWLSWHAASYLLTAVSWIALTSSLLPHQTQAVFAVLIFSIILALIYRSTRI